MEENRVITEAMETDSYNIEEKENACESDGVLHYEDSDIDFRILRAIQEMGFESMTPIQEQAIPVLLEGKDVIGQAQTGTGKTAAFGIPMLQRINEVDRSLQGIILCPTRELAMQAADEMRKFAKYLHGIRILPVYGGQEIGRQIKALKGGVQIIVGTPGRVMDHLRRHTIKPDNLRMVVLDEADEMLNMGFREDMEAILGQIPCEHQTALFSATMPQPILQITKQFQKEDAVFVKVTQKELTVDKIKQYLYFVRKTDKEAAAARLIHYYDLKRSLIFCNTKSMVDELAENLKNRGISAEGLHGDLSQAQRDQVMNRFRNGNLQILIATDVAARGIDVSDVDGVINYDVPQDIEYYVHRIGRTGRAGKEGMSFTLASIRELHKIQEIERVCKTKLEEQRMPDGSAVRLHKEKAVLDEVRMLMEQEDMTSAVEAIERYELETGIHPLELAAAFLRTRVSGVEEEVIEECRPPHRRRQERNSQRYGYGREQDNHYGGKYWENDEQGRRRKDSGSQNRRRFGWHEENGEKHSRFRNDDTPKSRDERRQNRRNERNERRQERRNERDERRQDHRHGHDEKRSDHAEKGGRFGRFGRKHTDE